MNTEKEISIYNTGKKDGAVLERKWIVDEIESMLAGAPIDHFYDDGEDALREILSRVRHRQRLT